ncbi:MAG: lipocalin family protein [Oryzomonas sp.]|uniref:lipocalin family protein n=1 Tax=Oryzomonas sp. TaxID=2855186 RepID=UPI00283F03FB|nr:lipocalin family protein [Oryzomonas sp.]MDR3578795.1 lipocalin family protein [Oryzomonas sp.]
MNSSVIVKIISIVFVVSVLFAGNGNATSDPLPVTPVQNVDLARYMGLWYEIARLEHFFQEGCRGSTASYTLSPTGEIEIINRCVKEKDNSLRSAKGRAWSVDPKGNARLKVSFFWPFRTDYWIIDLGRDYEYAVVGSPNRKYLWILARKPEMEKDVYKHILELVAKQGFDVGKLVRKP